MKVGGGTLLPTGTLTFLFTDVEGSTDLLREVGDTDFAAILATHSATIRAAVSTHGGVEVSTEGDSHFAVFDDVVAAVNAAIEIQTKVDVVAAGRPLRVRIGLHTGTAVLGGDNYVGVDVHKASRIADSGNGGQVLMSDVTSDLVEGLLPSGTTTELLGRFRLSGFNEPAIIHQVRFKGMANEFPPLRARPVDSRLPTSLTEFVGRSEEIGRGLELLGRSRLLTLTGPGGTGKTRLSLEIARRAESDFRDGAFFVPLAEINDPEVVPKSILEALRIETAGGIEPGEHLHRYLAAREMLLVLDNFEQLVEGAPVISGLLAAAPQVRVIVSSRSPLRVVGEHELPVPPLGVPGEGAALPDLVEVEGVKLFVSRAQAVRPDFVLGPQNAEAVASIARALDGLPLAIELAASRLRTFTPEVVLQRLNNQLLAGRAPGLPERQQTIVNTIGWSYDLLEEPTRRLFEQLSIFSGSFGLTEAEEICEGDVFDGLAELVDQSLLRQTETEGDPRFRMLTVIREFGYAALVSRGEDREAGDRHAAAYLGLAKRASEEIMTSKQGTWLARLTDDHDNLGAAMDHLLRTGNAEAAQALAGSLWRFWQIRGYIHEGVQRTRDALALAGECDPLVRAAALTGLGGLLYWKGATEEAESPYREALDLYRLHGTDRDVSDALYNLGFAAVYRGNADEAIQLFEQSRDLAEQAGWRLGTGHAYWALAIAATFDERWDDALRGCQQAIGHYEDEDAPFDVGWALYMMAHSHKGAGNLEEASSSLVPAISQFFAVRDYSALSLILTLAAALLIESGDGTEGCYILGGADRIKIETGVEIADISLNQYQEIADVRAARSDTEEASYQLGRMAPLEEVVAKVLDLLRGEGSGQTQTAG